MNFHSSHFFVWFQILKTIQRRWTAARKWLAMAAKANCIRTVLQNSFYLSFVDVVVVLAVYAQSLLIKIFSFQSRLLLLHSFNFFFSSTSHTCLRREWIFDLRNWASANFLSLNASCSYQITCHELILSNPRQMAINPVWANFTY